MKIVIYILIFCNINLNAFSQVSPGGFISDPSVRNPEFSNPMSTGMPGGYSGMPDDGMSGAQGNPFSSPFGNSGLNQQNPLLSKSCPFKKEVKGIKEILDTTKNQLAILASDTTCTNVASAAKVMNQTLSTSIQNAFDGQTSSSTFDSSYTTSTSNPTCNVNYEQNLSFDYNLALKMNTLDQTLLPNSYQKCISAVDFNKCASDLYVAQLAYVGIKCPEEILKKSRAQRNSQMLSNPTYFDRPNPTYLDHLIAAH